MELYQYDLSRVDGRTPGADGTFGYSYFDAYWKEPGRYPYLIRADGKWVGFALVNKRSWPKSCCHSSRHMPSAARRRQNSSSSVSS